MVRIAVKIKQKIVYKYLMNAVTPIYLGSLLLRYKDKIQQIYLQTGLNKVCKRFKDRYEYCICLYSLKKGFHFNSLFLFFN